MLKGDLASTPLAPLLLQLADDMSTGCLHISETEGDEALIYYKNGLVYAVSVPGRRPQLGAKLVSSGALAPEALADALEAQRTELQGWRLGELLVHLSYVDQPVVEAFIKEQVHDALWDLIKWIEGRWRFRKGEKTREDVAPPMAVSELLRELRERGAEWASISTIVHGPTAVPVLSTRGGGAPETTLDPDAWSMLCKIDGERSLAELARDCGYTLFEAGQVLVALVNAGLVDIEEDVDVDVITSIADVPQEELYGANSVSSALAADAEASVTSYEPEDVASDEPEDTFAALARLVTEVAASVRDGEPPAAEPEPEPAPVVAIDARARFNVGNDQSFAASLAKVSAALNDVLGPASTAADPYEVPSDLRIRHEPYKRSEDEERKARARAAAAAELAAAHALAEALRSAQAQEAAEIAAAPQPGVAEVVDLAAVRREVEEAARVAAEEAERAAAEEAERVEAERAEAERVAAEEAARVEAERAVAEEAARVEAERLAAEEAERFAADEAAKAEADAAKRAEEANERRRERRRAAREAARQEAERVATEEAERVAADEAARAEAERVAAEEAARVEAERVAADEAARAEAERVAAEEAARIEAERLAAEEAVRLEAERLAAEEAERIAAERAHAEDEAWAEYWAREAQAADAAAEATSLLVSLHAEPLPEPEPEPEPVVEEVAPVEVREPAAVGGRGGMGEMADTAALLRELSSLGLDDEPPSGSTPAAPPRQVRPATPEKKKKRGFLGF